MELHKQALGSGVEIFVPAQGAEPPGFMPNTVLRRTTETFVSKVAFTASPVKQVDEGVWFEVKLQTANPGYMNCFGIGITTTKPDDSEEIPATEEGAEPRRAVPQFAHEVPDSYLVGYQQAVYWKGARSGAEIDLLQMSPLDSDRVGVLFTAAGTVRIFVNGIERGVVPLPEGCEPPPVGDAMYGIIDLVGQCSQMELLDTYPPEGVTDEMKLSQVRRDLRRNFKSEFGELPTEEVAA